MQEEKFSVLVPTIKERSISAAAVGRLSSPAADEVDGADAAAAVPLLLPEALEVGKKDDIKFDVPCCNCKVKKHFSRQLFNTLLTNMLNWLKVDLTVICTIKYRLFVNVNFAGLGILSFQKNVPIFAFFSVLYKRMFRSLSSFPFFIKERSDLCILFRSL